MDKQQVYKIGLVGDLRKAIEGLPDNKPILSQVVAVDGKAWNCFFDFIPNSNNDTEFSFVSLSHTMLKTLPSCADFISENQEVKEKNNNDICAVFYLIMPDLKDSTVSIMHVDQNTEFINMSVQKDTIDFDKSKFGIYIEVYISISGHSKIYYDKRNLETNKEGELFYPLNIADIKKVVGIFNNMTVLYKVGLSSIKPIPDGSIAKMIDDDK